jgi:hypothetical protein
LLLVLFADFPSVDIAAVVNIELFEFHGCDKVFVSGVIVWGVGANVSIIRLEG